VTTDHAKDRIRWRCGLIVALIMMVVALLPQIHFAIHRGRDWHGTNAITHPDEVAYSAYAASLIRGNPRRYDPYTGRGAEAGAAESLFSIQLIPAYTIALPGRWLKLSAATLFMIFTPLCAFTASLAIFWFLSLLTRDARLSAAGVFVILCLGTLGAGQGVLRYLLNLNFLIPLWVSQRVPPPSLYHLPFLRLYQPGVAFPLFFVLGVFVWRALNESRRSRSALHAACAGVTFVVLVFSYFFLWTAAAAWLLCIALVWMIFRRDEFKRAMIVFGTIGAMALPAIIGYFVLLSHRAATVDSAQALVLTHRPDLFRLPEIISSIVLLMLAIGSWRRLAPWREPASLLAASLALMVFAIFNQQVVTGRSLQPIHYEWFIGNYCALAALVLAAKLCWRNQGSQLLTNRRLIILAVIALAWGVGEVWLAASMALYRNRANDEFRPVATRLTSLAQGESAPTGTALVSDLALADRLPTDAPQAVLWAPHMLVFPGVNETEDRERFLRQLYYLGYDEDKIWSEIGNADWNFYAGLFPYERLSPVINGKPSPITPDEIRAQIKEYLNYAAEFDQHRAAAPTLSYVVVRAREPVDFQNLDRWYRRDSGEQIGDFVLYRVNLR
jgi:hypothetical protein